MAGKRWSNEEIQFLIDNYGKERCEFCSRMLNRSKRAVYTMAERLGLNVEWTYERYDKDGYLEICLDSSVKVRYHRYVMEQFLGRPLEAREHVHHLDMNKTNNSLDNLIVLSPSTHNKLHAALNRNDYNYLLYLAEELPYTHDRIKYVKWVQSL